MGKKLTQKVTGNRGSIAAISAITKNGNLAFNLHDSGKRFSSADIIKFLGDLLKHHPDRHLVVIMDQAACHTADTVKKFVSNQNRLDVYRPDRQNLTLLRNFGIILNIMN